MTVLMTHFMREAPDPNRPETLMPDVSQAIMDRAMRENLHVVRVKLDYDEFLSRIAKVGKQDKESDGWNLRSEHVDMNKVNRTRARLQSAKASLWLFKKGGEEIGFCCAVKDGFNGQSEKFLRPQDNGTEIYKIALYDEHTHKGYGQVFLPTIMSQLFNGVVKDKDRGLPRISPSDLIYLNTRDSNYVDSRPFYDRLGFNIVGNEQWIEPGSGVSSLGYKMVPVNDQAPVSTINKRSGSDRRRIIRPGGFAYGNT